MVKKIGLIVVLAILVCTSAFLLLSNNSTSDISTITAPQPSKSSTDNPDTGGAITNVGSSLPFPLATPRGFVIGVFAEGVEGARDLELTDEGTVLVSSPQSNTVTALLDTNNDGSVDVKKVVVQGSNSVHGLSFYKGKLYVAEKSKLSAYDWDENSHTATSGKKLLDLPGVSNHVLRTLVFSPDGKLYISIGSNCNVCVESNPWVGSVIVTNENGESPRVFSKGQRNAPFLAVNPTTREIWATGMARDNLGDNIPADEINILKDGGDFGWPNCYGNKIHDTQFDTKKYIQDPCINTIAPTFEIAAHSAPLGLAFIPKEFNSDWTGDVLVAYHGSWNRSTKIGYKVVRMNVNGNTIPSEEDFITGFLKGSNTVQARPVDVLFDTKGNLYVSDDESGYIFIARKQAS